MNRSTISRMLLATDFSDSALVAHDYAAHIASAFGASIVILHVTDHRREMTLDEILKEEQHVQSQLRTLERMLEGHQVTVRRATGDPGVQIIATAEEVDADMIAMGLQGHENVAYGLIGSTVNSVTKVGICPVLAVPLLQREASPCAVGAPGPVCIRRILAPIDFSTPSMNALECAVRFALGLKSQLILVHVMEPAQIDWDFIRTEGEGRMRASWEGRLKELVDEAEALALSTNYDIRGGVPADSILAAALQHRCDLIIMGTHGWQGGARQKVGSVAEGVLKQTTCPVLTVKNGKFYLGDARMIGSCLNPSIGRHDT